MGFLNDWHDFVRAAAFLISLYAVVVLITRFIQQDGPNWNVKTKDLWFSSLMWSLAGCVLTAQGITLDRPFTPGFVFIIAAILVSAKGIHRKGEWGYRAA